MSNTGKNKTTLHRLEEKINKAYPTTSETIGTERERIVVEILDLLREEYDNEKEMVLKLSGDSGSVADIRVNRSGQKRPELHVRGPEIQCMENHLGARD